MRPHAFSLYICIYTVSQKKQDTKLLAITITRNSSRWLRKIDTRKSAKKEVREVIKGTATDTEGNNFENRMKLVTNFIRFSKFFH